MDFRNFSLCEEKVHEATYFQNFITIKQVQ